MKKNIKTFRENNTFLPYLYAIFSKRFKNLEYFTSCNESRIVSCESLAIAKKIIEKTGIDQDIMIK